MYAIIDYFTYIFGKIINVLNFRFFDDIPITFLEVILCGILIKAIIRFIFGGMKEVDTGTNFSSKGLVLYKINNYKRKQAIVNNKNNGIYVDLKTGRIYKKKA